MKNRDKLRRLKGRTEVEIGKMADDVVTMAVAKEKSLAETSFAFLMGTCRVYTFMNEARVDDLGHEQARQAVRNSCARHGLDFDEIAKYIW